MPNIESSPHPLVFKVANPEILPLPEGREEGIRTRTAVRSLEGMQKEAIVHYGPSGMAWRMVCDEGAYLNGTDLAPFPLAFFSAGLAFCYVSEILKLAKAKNVTVEALEVTQDSFYSLEGSFVKATMTGSALPVEFSVSVVSDSPNEVLQEIFQSALQTSPADALLRSVSNSEFALAKNGVDVPVEHLASFPGIELESPEALFDQAECDEPGSFAWGILSKLKIEQGPAEDGAKAPVSGFQAELKRMLNVRSVCKLRTDGLLEATVQLVNPVGSAFKFLADQSGTERAPEGMAYLSAGVGFCFMTQLGRYAKVAKQTLSSYRIVQDALFSTPEQAAEVTMEAPMAAVQTQVYLDIPASDETVQTIMRMGEQTCFLHAACQTPLATKINIA